ncbi:terminase small subunit [Agrobacterium leguminum]|uniref:terminase small subunit n=1 Tax=Agrobacterium leguminum TaxID=2792015 RepID=UPI003CE47E6D
MNATQAAIRAGYSAATAQEQGSRLLSNVMVKSAIDAAMNLRAERTDITEGQLQKSMVGISRRSCAV